MTDQIDIEALGRRATACKHWRWLPGMVALFSEEHGGTASRIDDDPTLTGSSEHAAEAGALPDLRDPCTIGGLLALVRAALGDQHLHVRPWKTAGRCEHEFGYWLCRIDGEPLNIARVGYSEAEALVAALEAAHKHHGPH